VAATIRLRAGAADFANPEELARSLGYAVERDHLPNGDLAWSFPRWRKIVLSPSGYEPRDAVSIAHELIELELPRRLEPRKFHEAFCQRGAAALILPRESFLRIAVAERWDLAALRRRFRRLASWELLATRAVDLVPGSAAAAWVRGALKWRRAWQAPGGVTDAERRAVARAMRPRGFGACRSAVAWRIAERGAGFRAISLALPAVS
jgi:hypothetical protein